MTQCISSICYPLVFSAVLVTTSGCAIRKHISKYTKIDSSHTAHTLHQDKIMIKDSAHLSHNHLLTTTYDSTVHLTYTFALPVTLQEIQQQTAPIIALATTHHIQRQQSQQNSQQTTLTHTNQQHYDRTQQTTHKQALLTTTLQLRRTPSYTWIIYIIGSLVLLAILVATLRKYLF